MHPIQPVFHPRFQGLPQRRFEILPDGLQLPLGFLRNRALGASLQRRLHLADVESLKLSLGNLAPGSDHFLVQAHPLAAHQHQPGMGHRHRRSQGMVGNHPRRHAMDFPLRRPDFRAQQPQRHLHQTVIQVRQNDLITPLGLVMVKHNRPDLPRMRMPQPNRALLPASPQRRKEKRLPPSPLGGGAGGEGRLPRHFQCHLHCTFDALRGQLQGLAGFVQLVGILLHLLFQVTLKFEQFPQGAGVIFRKLGIQFAAFAQHGFLHLGRDHHAYFAQILADVLHLLRRPRQELQVRFQLIHGQTFGLFFVAIRHEVIDQHLVFLTVPVHAPVALFHAVGVPRDFKMHQPVAVILQVNAFRCSIGRQQDAHRALVGAGLESRLDLFALFIIHPTVKRQKPLALGQAFGGQQGLQPVLRGAILGKDDHPLVRPLSACPRRVAGFHNRLQPLDKRLGLAVADLRCPLRPGLHLAQKALLLAGQFAH